MADDYVADTPVAEGLNIVDHPINPSAANLKFYVLKAVEYGIWICIVGILLGKGATGVWHGELALYLVEDNPCSILLKVVVKVSGKYRWDADIGYSEHILRVGLAPSALGDKTL